MGEDGGIDDLKAKAFSRIMKALRAGTLEQAMSEAIGKAASKEEMIEQLKEHVEVLTTTLAQLAQENTFLRQENALLRNSSGNDGSALAGSSAGSGLQAIRAATQREEEQSL